jgi:L-rhamnose mutarotase
MPTTNDAAEADPSPALAPSGPAASGPAASGPALAAPSPRGGPARPGPGPGPGAGAARPERVCFRLRVRPDRLDEYRQRHAQVWPEMLREIEASGRRNYSLFLHSDGTLTGYFETDDAAGSEAYLAASETAARWEAEMAPFFEQLDGRPDQGFERLPEIFNLADQLAAADPDHARPQYAQKDIS